MNPFWLLRVWAKWLFSRFAPIPNYCKRCGRTCEDFHVPDWIWRASVGRKNQHKELCIRCFSEKVPRALGYFQWRPHFDGEERP